MTIKLTEEIIQKLATERSYQRGREYYLAGAIYSPAWQTTPGGIVLRSMCSGNSAHYTLQVELDENGINSTSCTCAYDGDGDCKHIVALLLEYLHQPEKFFEEKSVADLVSGLDKEALIAIITRLVKRDPDLYDELERAMPAVKVVTQPRVSAMVAAPEKRKTDVSEPVYRKMVQKIFKQSRHADYYDDDEVAPAYLDDLKETLESATQYLAAGDAEGALIILRVLFEETVDEYDGEMDYDGDVAGFIQDLGMPLAEAILSVNLNAQESAELKDSLQATYNKLDEYVESSELDVVFSALRYGWDASPDSDLYAGEEENEVDDEENDENEDVWMAFSALQQARLNVLERQGRIDEYLRLAQKADTHRYVLKLLQIGRMDDAISASQKLMSASAILDVAQKLRSVGRLEAAITLAERGLEPGSHFVYELANWLAPLEEEQGRYDKALVAYRAAYDAHPAINLYRHVKRLSGKNWETLRPTLTQQINEAQNPDVLADIHLEESNWDAAIVLAEKYTWSSNLLEKVSNAVIAYRPDWVINTALRQATGLIAPTQSKLYPGAATWLARAKKAYQQKSQMAEWQVYIEHLRTTYARRPALMKAIKDL
ncbi:MAG: SWIM zinc finger family protein [Chloroflexota bacterium]